MKNSLKLFALLYINLSYVLFANAQTNIIVAGGNVLMTEEYLI